jgi:hypothetical protein
MLPDYTETKKLFGRFFQTYMRQKARTISPLADVQTRFLHEGRSMRVKRPDDSESNSEVQLFSSTMEVRIDEIPDFTLEKAIAKFDEMVLDMARQQTGFALGRISEEIPSTQTVNAKGKTLDAEMVLEMFEAIQLEFYPDGRPHELHVIGGLFTPERMRAVDEEFANNRELQRRRDDLIEKKREDWRAREASRKLVG